MAKLFENIRVDDQIEQTASHCIIYADDRDYDPNRITATAIVTHIWYDPVEDKEYIAFAHIRKDGKYGKPKEKRTLTGLARCGWRPATKDWIALAKALHDADKSKVISLRKHR